jgi:hypothetical protein
MSWLNPFATTKAAAMTPDDEFAKAQDMIFYARAKASYDEYVAKIMAMKAMPLDAKAEAKAEATAALRIFMAHVRAVFHEATAMPPDDDDDDEVAKAQRKYDVKANQIQLLRTQEASMENDSKATDKFHAANTELLAAYAKENALDHALQREKLALRALHAVTDSVQKLLHGHKLKAEQWAETTDKLVVANEKMQADSAAHIAKMRAKGEAKIAEMRADNAATIAKIQANSAAEDAKIQAQNDKMLALLASNNREMLAQQTKMDTAQIEQQSAMIHDSELSFKILGRFGK